jgi:polysaccharide chain length determinant protein (PEP-CTERM system associated)
MIPGRKFTPDYLLRLVWKRRLLIIAPLFLCTLAALVISRQRPDLYQADALIQIIAQRVPNEFVRPTVTTKVEEQLQSISQEVRSRTRLEQIILEQNLYPEKRRTEAMEDTVNRMRSAIEMPLVGPSGRPPRAGETVDSFRVIFSHSDPRVALRVTERLASWVIDENARLRGTQAEATATFLETQLADARKRLEDQEARLQAFRERHTGRLPTQAESNRQSLQGMEMQAQQLGESIARDRDRRNMLERLYNDAQMQPTPVTPGASAQNPAALPTGSPREQLDAARARLALLQVQFTEQHPDVVRQKSTIRDLEKKVAAEPASPTGTTPTTSVSVEEANRRSRLSQQRAEIESLGRQIQFKEGEERRLRATIGEYRGRLEAVPGLEAEYTKLTRDYDTLSDTYKDLLEKSEASKMAENLERRQGGQQFRILDAPRVSERVVGANRLQINLAGFGLGLLLGLASVALLELRDSSFRNDAEVVQILALPVLASVPQVLTANDLRRAYHLRLLVLGVSAVVLLASTALIWRLELWRYVR